MNSKWRLALWLLVWMISMPAAAQPVGDKDKALALYDQGNTKYNLGKWNEAIDLFTKAYEAYSAPEFLFNIGQAHRQAGHCQEALFFYRRYLANKADAPNRSEVEGFIAELATTCREEKDPSESSDLPDRADTSDPQPTEAEPTRVAQSAPEDEAPISADISQDDRVEDHEGPALLATHVAVGPSFLAAGDLDIPVLVGLSISVGYPIRLGQMQLEPGLALTYTNVPWDGVGMEGVTGRSGLVGILANLGGAMPLAGDLSLHGEAGVGVLVMGGLYSGNPFLRDGESADGPISMLHVRGALGVEYALSRNLALFADPVVLSISPAGDLHDEISTLMRYEVLAGAAYRM